MISHWCENLYICQGCAQTCITSTETEIYNQFSNDIKVNLLSKVLNVYFRLLCNFNFRQTLKGRGRNLR